MRVNPYTAAFAEVGQYFRRSTTSKNQASSDFSASAIKEDRVSLSDRAIQTLSDTNAARPGKSAITSSSYYFHELKVPNVEFVDNGASAYRVHRSLENLKRKKNRSSIIDNLSIKSPFLNKQIQSLMRISEKLSYLKSAIDSVSRKENFNIKVARSSNPGALKATTSAESPSDTFNIKISQLAVTHQLVSDEVSEPFAALGASGAVTVNGFEIDIVTTDSLDDIKNKINFGEDYNQNGVLDAGEDINGNGKLEVLQVSSNPYAKGIYIIEDINGDNIIQETEDSNGDELLNGGTAEHGVVAKIIDNRLYLETLPGSSYKIEIQDHNDVLFDLGFFELDIYNNVVLKEEQLDPDTGENLNISPASSLLSVDGESFDDETNDITDAIPGTVLHLQDTTTGEISLTISTDLTEALKNIKNFISAYNDTIKLLNNELAFNNMLEADIAVQKIRNGLNDRITDDVLNADQKFNNLEKLGITVRNQSKSTFNELAIGNLETNLNREASNSLSLPPKGTYSIFWGLEKIGIRTKEDDTLTMDDRKFKKILEKNPSEVINLFTEASSGIVEKLDQLIDVRNDPLRGTIALQKLNKNSLLSDTSEAADLISSGTNVSASRFGQSGRESILLSVRV